jgi:hypothetical protein
VQLVQLGLVGCSFLSEKKLHLYVAHIMMPFFLTPDYEGTCAFLLLFSKMVQQVTPQTILCIGDNNKQRVFGLLVCQS